MSAATRQYMPPNGRLQTTNLPYQSDVPRAVAALLETTKQLQETLRLWSVSQASEIHVSGVYVRLGTEFNSTVVAFQTFGIDMSEIYQIPQDLRTVLEGCLSEDPSIQTLNKYLPRVRQIIATLLRGLQSKQTAYWNAVGDASMRR
ncbi:hypothetical protein B0F90DRAFT_957798 [Multifurca ochricompacta]|uniref:Aip3p/Bud6 N-terminal domain-containing protein n=1 Tax=Multifurca ochricompacta TaxID=376703 RepID=A0AAD4M9J6_9AGAM|nr:hypothetical protein B0F90DRAFT_957798 [Multifurca ochricompacta]